MVKTRIWANVTAVAAWLLALAGMYLLLALGLVVMLGVFTAWGLWEILAMPKGTLP